MERLILGTGSVADRGEAQDAEAAIMRSSKDAKSYIDAATATIGKLRLGPVPCARDLPFCPDEELLRGTPFQKECADRAQAKARVEEEIQAITAGFSLSAKSRFSSACPRCGANGDDIQEIDAQTRAADEGASVLGLCFKCGFRWKS